jgi:hypothetical protein
MNGTNRRRITQSAPQIPLPQISPFWGLLPRTLLNKVKDFFVYGTSFLPLGAGLTVTNTITIEADSDFLFCALNVITTDVANVVFAASQPFLIALDDTASGRRFQNGAVHVDTLRGTGQLPGYLPFAKLLRANGALSITLQNLDAANGFNVRVSCLGFKVFAAMEG